jgi:hypothetical protein
MSIESDSEEVLQVLIAAIEKDIRAHESGDFEDISMGYDDVLGELLPFHDKNDVVGIALEFWDCWGDASRHEWRHYDGIGKDDWPALARSIIESIRVNRMPENQLIIEHFAPRPRTPWIERLRRFFGVSQP